MSANRITTIEPLAGWLDFRFKELWQYRDLVALFVRRDLVAKYKQTVLGPLWYLIQPLLTTVTFTIIFGNVAGISTDGLPHFPFYLAGNVLWTYFAASLTNTSNTFTANMNLFGKVYFPRMAVPIALLFSDLVKFMIQFGFFLIIILYYSLNGSGVQPNAWVLLTPYLILVMAVLGLGLGTLASSITAKYRDLSQLISFGVSLLMFATPVIYPLSAIPTKYRWLVVANPMTSIVEGFRFAYLGSGHLSGTYILYSTVFAFTVLLFGMMVFNRVERVFMDTV